MAVAAAAASLILKVFPHLLLRKCARLSLHICIRLLMGEGEGGGGVGMFFFFMAVIIIFVKTIFTSDFGPGRTIIANFTETAAAAAAS